MVGTLKMWLGRTSASLALKSVLAAAAVSAAPSAALARHHDLGRLHVDVAVGPQRVWVEPVYRTVMQGEWVPAEYRTVTERVWVPARWEVREGRHWHERACVEPGHYDVVSRQELLCAGHWASVERQELVTPGHWERPAVPATVIVPR